MAIAPMVKPRTRCGSYETFERRYKPVENERDETILREWDQIPSGTDASYIWTVVDGDDGKLYLTTGVHYVNRVGYVLCEVPFSDIEDSNPGYVY